MRQERLAILKAMSEKFDVPAVLVYSCAWRKENFRYLTGLNFYGSNAMVLYLRDTGEVFMFLSSPYDESRAGAELKGVQGFLPMNGRGLSLARLLESRNIKALGLSGGGLFPAPQAKALRDRGVEFKSAEGFIERIRYRKTAEEVECLRAAVHLADRAFPVFVDAISRGLNEFRIVAEVEYALKKMGAEDNFMLISTGRKEVYGMTPPMNRVAKPGDLVLTELTPQLNGWWCQICRTVVKGEPSGVQKRIFDIFMEAEEAGLALTRPGVNITEVAKAENDVFRKYGYGDYITSRYTRVRGHGHGMHLDEAPTVNEGVDLVIEEGMVIVIHPNTYNPETGYMVMGDPVVVTKDGNRMLSTTERRLFQAE
ncbi:MAG: Xaa-Pro peptidase family protein [Spirochaetaceae bacterium]|jgi:Xaa-Pro aminopeptidase|nr:Xaa-Pro peptidase family protein [Spirochaetaceae bacterium]